MATLWKRKIGGKYIYYVDFYLNGKRIRKSTKTGDRKLAELFLKDIEVKIAKDEFGFDDLKKKNIGLKDFADKYVEFSKATKAENTYLLDEHSPRVLIDFWGNVFLKNVTIMMLEEFKVKRSETVKPTSVNLEIRHLKAAFETAKKWGYIKENPFKGLKQIKIKGSNFPRFLSKKQVRILFNSIPEGDFWKLVQFYLYTG